MLEEVVSSGGEGIIIRKSGSMYEHGRSNSLFKYKISRGDREALVVTSNSLFTRLKLPEGTDFTVATPKNIKLKKGDVVTFTYTTFSRKSIPTQTRIVRIRSDVSWKDVLQDHINNRDDSSLERNEYLKAPKPKTFWVTEKGKNMRTVFETYAKKMNFDPLIAENWYSFRLQTLSSIKGGQSILKHFKNSHVAALIELFPEIGLDRSKFHGLSRNYWTDLKNRRNFLLEVAKKEQFSPHIAENWYNMSLSKFQSYKGGISFLSQYHGNWPRALIHLFPDLHFDVNLFNYNQRNFWHVRRRRDLFESFAHNKGFDPAIPENWYMVRKEDIVMFENMNTVLEYYNGSVVNALVQLFPEINKKKLALSDNAHWKDINNQRTLFEQIAKDHGFDSLVPNNWYSIKYDTLASYKGGLSMLGHYNDNYRLALLTVFPNIGLTYEKFQFLSRGYWCNQNNQRAFFMLFARVNNFDPLLPESWYNISNKAIISMKGGKQILAQYNNSLIITLQSVFPEIFFDTVQFK